MSYSLEPQDSVVAPSDQIAQPTYFDQYENIGDVFQCPAGGSPLSDPISQSYSHPSDQIAQPTYSDQYEDIGDVFQSPAGGSPLSYPTPESYPQQNAAELGLTKDTSDDEESLSALINWDPPSSTPPAVASPRLATADVVQPPHRREQQEWMPLPDGTLGNTTTGVLSNYSAVADYPRRIVSEPNHGSCVFNPSGAIGASQQDLASPRPATADVVQPPCRREQPEWIPIPDGTLGNTTTGVLPNYSAVADYPRRIVSDPNHGSYMFHPSGAIGASRQDLASVPRSVSGPSALGRASHNQMTHEFPVLSSSRDASQQLPPNSLLPPDSQILLDSQLPLDSQMPPDTQPITDWQRLNDCLAQFPELAPPSVRPSQACQPPKDHGTADQCRVEDSLLPDLDVPVWTPPYGQPNFCPGPQPQQKLALQKVNPKKRGRQELGPLDGEEFANIFTEFEGVPPRDLNFDQGPRIETRRRSKALPWDAHDLDGLPRNKRLRLGNGNASFVDTTAPLHEDGPSAINEQLYLPDSLQDVAYGDLASVAIPPVIPNPKAKPNKSNRPVKKRISRSVKQRSHGDLVAQADGTYLFREFGKDDWEPTAYHEDLREEMIETMLSFGEYDEPPASGPELYDQTAFEPTQLEWTFNGHHGWHPSQDRLMYRFERRDHRDPNYEPGPLRFDGYVILSKNNEVITGWRDMPLTVSSSIEGGRIENIQRIDSRIAIEDFQDRMPSMVSGKPVQGRSAFTNRTMRYRLENGLASWQPRDGSSVIKDIMLRHLTRQQLIHNTTRGYRGLTDDERAEIRNNNVRSGRYASRAGKKALPRS